MITIRSSENRGHVDYGWLTSHHTFTFASYKDPSRRGFGTHAHRDMEILSYVLERKLAHKDSMGHVEVLGPNEIQKMSTGNDVIHSEFKGFESEPFHFLQICIKTKSKGTAPAYEQIAFQPEEKRNRLKVLASSAPVAISTVHGRFAL